jgi:NAD(P)-dependent dehydrogenase (short-subunit alcohol dehydrogenase family)
LAEAGAKVVLGARRTDRLEALKKDIEAAGGVAAYKETDVVSRDQVVALIKTANDTFGPVRLIPPFVLLLLLLFVLFIYLTNRAWLGARRARRWTFWSTTPV